MVNYTNGKTCSLFGHRKISDIEKVVCFLKEVLIKLINKGYSNFYVGNHGDFDRISLGVLKRLKNVYRNININIVITNFYNLEKDKDDLANYILFDIEEIHPKRRILFSNNKMVDKSDIIIFYVNPIYDNTSGAKRVFNLALKKQKEHINIYDFI